MFLIILVAEIKHVEMTQTNLQWFFIYVLGTEEVQGGGVGGVGGWEGWGQDLLSPLIWDPSRSPPLLPPILLPYLHPLSFLFSLPLYIAPEPIHVYTLSHRCTQMHMHTYRRMVHTDTGHIGTLKLALRS